MIAAPPLDGQAVGGTSKLVPVVLRTAGPASPESGSSMSAFLRSLSLVHFLLLALVSPDLRADGGPCEDYGWRKVTAAEAKLLKDARDTMLKRLPPAPEGWALEADEPLRDQDMAGTCVEPSRPLLTLSVSGRYRETRGEDARNQKRMESAQQTMADWQAPGAGLQAEVERVSKLLEAAAARGDFAEVERLGKQLEASTAPLRDQGEAIQSRLDSMEKEISWDTEASLTITLNPGSPQSAGPLREVKVPDSGFAFEEIQDGDEDREAPPPTTWIRAMVGPWRRVSTRGQTEFAPPVAPRPGAAPPATLLVEIEAEPSRARDLLTRLAPARLLQALEALAARPAAP